MKFNSKKCYLLSSRTKTSHFYTINDQILKQVQDNPYLGLTISDNLKWKTHINNICKKANSTLGFLRRNLRHCPKTCRKNAYLALVRSKVEYGSIIWDPYNQSDIDRLERIQRSAALSSLVTTDPDRKVVLQKCSRNRTYQPYKRGGDSRD